MRWPCFGPFGLRPDSALPGLVVLFPCVQCIIGVQYRKSISEFDTVADDLVRHFYGGFVRMHILYHAAKGPIGGVEMMKELRRHGYKLGPGTLYPILHHLEESGFLASQ